MSSGPIGIGRSGTARVAVNGLITWTQIVGVLAAKLVTTRLLLEAMGIEGYGAYFAATSVALLVSFLTSAMQATSLRAITLETAGDEAISRLFSALLGLHLVVAFAIMVIGATLGLWFVNNTLAIPVDLTGAVAFSFLCVLTATIVGAILAPYEAFLQSRERFGVYASLEVLRTWMLVPVSFCLLFFDGGRLEIYALITAGAAMITTLIGVMVALRDYPATRPKLRHLFDVGAFRLHGSIFSWTIVGSLSAVGRNQGLMILVNVVGGPVASAAFAVGNQIPAALLQFSTSIRTVMVPRIYSREAHGDRAQMVGLAFTACKMSMLVTVGCAVPLIVEMPILLQLWLGRVDPVIVFVASLMLVNQVIDQSSAGTGIAHTAIGRLARYQLVAGGLSLLMLPVAYFVGQAADDFRDVLWVTVAFTALVSIVRVALLDNQVPGAMLRWLRDTIARVIAALVPALGLALVIEMVMLPSIARLGLTLAATTLLFLGASYLLALTGFEKDRVRGLFWRRVNPA